MSWQEFVQSFGTWEDWKGFLGWILQMLKIILPLVTG